MSPELLTEYSRRSRFFAVAGITLGILLVVAGSTCFLLFILNPDTDFSPSNLQAGSLLASGLLLVLACLSPWVQDSVLREETEAALAEQAQQYAAEIESLRNRLRAYEPVEESSVRLEIAERLTAFFRKWDRYGFNLPRIQKWGGRKKGFEIFKAADQEDIQNALNSLLAQGVVRTRLSKQGSVLYQINKDSDNNS